MIHSSVRRLPSIVAFGLVVALSSCRRESNAPACDLAALTKLGEALAAQPVAAQVETVWPGILAACGDGLPMPLAQYIAQLHDPTLEQYTVLLRQADPVLVGLQRRACPSIHDVAPAAVDAPPNFGGAIYYEGCDYARFGVLSAEEVEGTWNANPTWATHQWLLDQGLDSRAAAPITGALYALEQVHSWPIERRPDLRLPNAHGVAIFEGFPIYVTREHIQLNRRILAVLDDGALAATALSGRVIVELYDELVSEVERSRNNFELLDKTWDGAAWIVADAQTPMPTIVDVLHTARVTGLDRYGFAVAPEAYVPTYIPVSLPVLYAAKPEPALMRIELSPEGLTLSRGRAGDQTPNALALTQLDAVTSFAEAVHRDDPSTRLVISAADTVRLELLLQVIAAARGPDCRASGDGCLVAEVMLLPHGYTPSR